MACMRRAAGVFYFDNTVYIKTRSRFISLANSAQTIHSSIERAYESQDIEEKIFSRLHELGVPKDVWFYEPGSNVRIVIFGEFTRKCGIRGVLESCFKLNDNVSVYEACSLEEMRSVITASSNTTTIVVSIHQSNLSPCLMRSARLTREQHVPHFAVFADGGKVVSYLSLNDGITACIECLVRRMAANNLNVSEEALRNHLLDSLSLESEKTFDPLLSPADILALVSVGLKGIQRFISECKDWKAEIVAQNGEVEAHSVLPTPFCQCQKNPIESQPLSEDILKLNSGRTEKQTSELDLEFINQHCGIFRRIYDVSFAPEVGYRTINVRFLRDFSSPPRREFAIAGGVSLSQERALGKAIGEAIERYEIQGFSRERIRVGCASELALAGYDCASIPDFFLHEQYSESGFPFVKYSVNESIAWTTSWNLTQKRMELVPCDFVFSRSFELEGVAHICHFSTSGAATSVSVLDAAVSGLLELFERDSTMLTWLLKRNCPRVELSENWLSRFENVKRQCDFIESQNYVVSIFLTTSDLKLPSFLAIAERRDDLGPCFLIGAACRFEVSSAIERSLEEIIQGMAWQKLKSSDESSQDSMTPNDVRDFRDRVFYYSDRRNGKALEFILSSDSKISVEECEDSLNRLEGSPNSAMDFLLDVLRKSELDALIVHLTTEDCRRLGFYTVKMIVPGLVQIDADHRVRFLGHERLKKIAASEGLAIPMRVKDFNQDPHPFP